MGDTELLKDKSVPDYLREMPERMDAGAFRDSASQIARALGVDAKVTEDGTWIAPDYVIHKENPSHSTAAGKTGAAMAARVIARPAKKKKQH